MKHFRIFLYIAAVLLAYLPATAQIQATLKMDRALYVSHEPITGTLTIINRAGQDLVFGDSGRLSWLDFTVTDGRGNMVTPVQHHLNERPIVLSSGQTYEHEVTVNRYYPMANIGTYRVRASVSFPQINRVFQTTTQSIQVTEGQAMWNQIVGVPQGHVGAGSYREYSLMTFYHGARSRALYFRLKNSDSGVVYRTYPIGDYMSLRKPTHAIDKQNQLHVLHMSGPQRYKYTVINIEGDPVTQENFYEKGANRPQLDTTSYGEVSVIGGISELEMATPYEETEFRLLSDRPAGLPNF